MKILREFANKVGVERFGGGLDLIGDIAVLRIYGDLDRYERELAEHILREIPRVRAVYRHIGPPGNEYRVWKLKWLAGERRSVTIHRENGYMLMVDVTKTFFTPKLHHEHMRLAVTATEGERILNMFSGVGGFSIAVSIYSEPKLVVGVDLNPCAAYYHNVNAHLNGVAHTVMTLEADSGKLNFSKTFDRVIMPLPAKVKEYLPIAISYLGRLGWIHAYDFVKAKNKVDARRRATKLYRELVARLPVKLVSINSLTVGSVAPHLYRVAVDMEIEKPLVSPHSTPPGLRAMEN